MLGRIPRMCNHVWEAIHVDLISEAVRVFVQDLSLVVQAATGLKPAGWHCGPSNNGSVARLTAALRDGSAAPSVASSKERSAAPSVASQEASATP